MSMTSELLLTSWISFAFTLGLLRLTQHWLERHLLGLSLLLTRRIDAAVMVYYVVMLPGVLVHEVSHWLMAGMLGVTTIRLVIWPERTETGGLRLGYLETETPEIWRSILIGVAPLFSGLAIVLLLSHNLLGLPAFAEALTSADLSVIIPAAERLIRTPDFWAWLYLMFTIANNMMPSGPDRRDWPALVVMLILLGAALALMGFAETVWAALGGPVAGALGIMAAAFTPIIVLNLFAIVLVWLLETAAGRLTGRRVDYDAASGPGAAQISTPQDIQSLLDMPLPVPAPPVRAPLVEPDPVQLGPDLDEHF
ncbi:MAG: hypothetical protein JXB47_13820 [Anaerolineae bacterium]|nr:hypothetical protein [Anaerolineae bacterium]